MKQYRTLEQFETIVNSAYNGNIGISANQAVEYGFYAVDLKRMLQDNEEQFHYINPFDLYQVIEIMTDLRNKEVN